MCITHTCNLVNYLYMYVHSEMQPVRASPGLMACVCDSPFFTKG
jgi:hypothetical protein